MSSIEEIPNDWKKVVLGEVADTNPDSIGKNYPYQDILYLDTGSITKGKIDLLQTFNLNEAPSRAKRLVQNKDIVYSTVRPNQEHYGFISEPKKNMVVSTGFTVIRAHSIDEKLLYYYLSQGSVTNYLHTLAEHSTSAYPSIKPIDLENLSFSFPNNKLEQKAIANILTAFDDKIENLQAQNKTLEQTAQTIFKEWFGKYQVGDELPDGWRVGKLNDICNIEKGLSYKGKHVVDNGVPMVNLGSVLPGGGYRIKKIKFYNGDFKERHTVKPGDIIIANTDMTYDRIILGSPFIVPKFLGDKVLFTHHLFSIKTEEKFKPFIFYYLKDSQFRAMAESSVTGTTVLALPINDVINFSIVIPNNSLINKFNQIVKPVLEKKEKNVEQIQTLKKTRDTLLPKLMSGKIRVKL